MTSLRKRFATRPGVIVQGLAGLTGRAQLAAMQAQGTNVVAGVSARFAGIEVGGVRVLATMAEARRATGATVALLFVPAVHVRDATITALDAGVTLLVIPAEGVPVMDALSVSDAGRSALIIGPNSPGIIVPGVVKLGFMPSGLLRPGPVGLVSRSGTLSYEVSLHLAECDLGISTWIGVGGDVAPFLSMPDAAALVADDDQTQLLVIVGEVGGTGEERLAQAVRDGGIRVPIHALIVGRSAPAEEPLGHAGAVMLRGSGGYSAKVDRLREAGVIVHSTPWDLVDAVARHLADMGGRADPAV